MPINLKVFGLTVVAAFAMSAIVSSAASANQVEAELESASGFVTATSTTDVFTAGSSAVTCDHAEFSGTFTSPTKTLTITPKYTGCTAFGIANTHVLDTGCAFEFTLNNTHSNNLETGSASARLECGNPATGHIVLTPTLFGSSHCTITFAEQNVKGSLVVTANTVEGPDDLTVDKATLGSSTEGQGIGYDVTKSGLGCPSVKNDYTNGSYHVSTTTVRGFSDAAHKVAVGGKLITNET